MQSKSEHFKVVKSTIIKLDMRTAALIKFEVGQSITRLDAHVCGYGRSIWLIMGPSALYIPL